MQSPEFSKDFLLLQELFVDLKLEGWDVTFFDKTSLELKRGFGPHFRIIIKSEDKKKFTIDRNITDTLKRAVYVMSDLGYDYVAHYYGFSGGTCRLYIYQDDRNLRASGIALNKNGPELHLIEIGFRGL